MTIQSVTLGKMINLSDSQHAVELPERWINAVTEQKSFEYAIFFMSSDSTIRFIPTQSSKVIKFHVDVSDKNVPPDFLNQVLEQLVKLDVQSLFNSGVCFFESECFFEFFVDHPKNEEKVEKIIEALNIIKGVKETIITIVSL